MTSAIPKRNIQPVPTQNAQNTSPDTPKYKSRYAQSLDKETKRAYTKAEKRIAYRRARESGTNIAQSCKIAGVSVSTGSRWERQIERGVLTAEIAKQTVISKDEALALTSAIIKDDHNSPDTRLRGIERLSRMADYEAPTRSSVEVRSIPVNVQAWIETAYKEARQRELTAYNERAAIDAVPDTAQPIAALGTQDSASQSALPGASDDQVGGGSPNADPIDNVSSPPKISPDSGKQS